MPSAPFPMSNVTSFAANFNITPYVYYALVIKHKSTDPQGIFRSTNSGSSWTHLTTGFPSTIDWTFGAFALAPSNPSVLYATVLDANHAVYVPGHFNGGYFSTNGGASWAHMTSLSQNFVASLTSSTYDFGYTNPLLYVDPRNSEILYGGRYDLAVTTCARCSTGNWRDITSVSSPLSSPVDNSNITPYIDSFTFARCAAAPCGIYLGTDGGVYDSFNTTVTPASSVHYGNLNTTGLAISAFEGGSLGADYASLHRALGNTYNTGTDLFSGAQTWNAVNSDYQGSSFATVINPVHQQYMYAPDAGYSSGLQVSSNDGATWAGLSSHGLFNQTNSVSVDRLNDQHLVVGGSNYATNPDVVAVYESLDRGATWHQSSQNFHPSTANEVDMQFAVVAPGKSSVIYALTLTFTFSPSFTLTPTLYRTTHGDSGTQQTYINAGALPADAEFDSLTVDPKDATGMTLFIYGYAHGLYKSTDGGATWHLPPSPPANSYVFDFYRPAAIYYSGTTRVLVMGNDNGVFYTTNDGASWTRVGTGLPVTYVSQVAIDQAATIAIAFTYGRGAWAIGIH